MTAQSVTGIGPGDAHKRIAYLSSDLPKTKPTFTASNPQDLITGESGGGDIFPLDYTVFVGKNGNDATADGSISKPFLTVQAAMEYAWTNLVLPIEPQPIPPFRRPCIFVSAGTYNDGDLVLPPQICVLGEGFNHSRIQGNWTIDSRWSNYNPLLVPSDFRSSWINIGLFGDVDIDFDPVLSNEGKIYATDVRFGGDVIIAEKRVNPVSNSFTLNSCEILGNLTLIGIPTLLENCVTKGGTLFITQAVGAVPADTDNIFQSSGGSFGNIVITSTTPPGIAPIYICDFNHSVQSGATLTLDGPYININADISSIPLQSLIVLLGGATLNLIKAINPNYFSGITADRPPTPYTSQQWFDTTIGLPVWWNGASWINAAGVVV